MMSQPLNSRIYSYDVKPGLKEDLQQVMWELVGILRDQDGLNKALRILETWEEQNQAGLNVKDLEFGNMLCTGLAITQAALAREESRGAHYRSDFKQRLDPIWQKHSVQNKEDGNVSYVPITGDN